MKTATSFISSYKTTIAGLLLAVVTALLGFNVITVEQGVMITGVLGALGFVAAKDSTVHSISDQVAKADAKKEETGAANPS